MKKLVVLILLVAPLTLFAGDGYQVGDKASDLN